MDGLDAEYFKKNLQQLARDADSYTPDEMSRALCRLSGVAKERKPAAWVRFCCDSVIEGPIANCDSRMDEVRMNKGDE